LNSRLIITLLDDSDATLGPGLISIPDIINKINNTENRYLHISITELSESKIGTDSLKLPGYKPPYRRDRVDRLGGGVVVFVKDEINCVTRLDLHVGSVECQGFSTADATG
jgi:hypothetical protein